MKLQWMSRALREERRHIAREARRINSRLTFWHTVRLWWPTRVSPTQVMWLEIVARRADKVDYKGKVKVWMYGPASNVLVTLDEAWNKPDLIKVFT